MGCVPSHTRVLVLNPEAYGAWRTLQPAIAGSLGMRRYELVTLAAARGRGSAACLLAHGKTTRKFMAEADLIRLARDHHDADLSAAEVAMTDFAHKLSTNDDAMDDGDSQSLRDVGFSDREIVDIALAAAARSNFSKVLQALAIGVDVPPGLSRQFQDALLALPGAEAPAGQEFNAA